MDQEGTNTFNREKTLVFLQLLVKMLVSTSGLFDHDSGSSSSGSYRLQTLRQRHSSPTNFRNEQESRRSLTEWDPFPEPQPPELVHIDVPRPPDPAEKHFSTLARITVLMAGAIFGAILFYLCCKNSSTTSTTSTRLTEYQSFGVASQLYAYHLSYQELSKARPRIRYWRGTAPSSPFTSEIHLISNLNMG